MEKGKYEAEFAILVGGSVVDETALKYWSNEFQADIFAADSGLSHLVAAGLGCKAVVGDMDSLPVHIQHNLPSETAFHQIAEQETTDFEKLLNQLDCLHLLGFGFMDGQFDHALSVLSVCAKFAATHHIVLVGLQDAMLVTTRSVTLETADNCRFSLWPIDPIAQISSSGLKWPVNGLALSPSAKTATSNRTSEIVQTITVEPHNKAAYALIMDKKWAGQMVRAEFR